MEALGQQLGALNEQLREQLAYTRRVQVLCVAVAACSCALFGLRRATPSYYALAVVLPIIVINAWLPTLFSARDELITRVITALLTAWLANFKVGGGLLAATCKVGASLLRCWVLALMWWVHTATCCPHPPTIPTTPNRPRSTPHPVHQHCQHTRRSGCASAGGRWQTAHATCFSSPCST